MKPNDIPKELNSLGDHLKKKRLTLQLFQKGGSLRLGISECTYHNWETNKTEPIISMFPRIIEFLGYYPFPEPKTLGERILAYRRKNGLSLFRMAKTLGVDESTLSRWEKGEVCPNSMHAYRLNKIVEPST
ncbi:helix-turn-helix domain-containing protein [Nitrospinota bacterium]